MEIKESDWKVFRRLHAIALERFCDQILMNVKKLVSTPSKSAHERYLAVFKELRERDKEMAEAFDGPRRSMALLQLAAIQRNSLLTKEEMGQLSRETIEFLDKMVS